MSCKAAGDGFCLSHSVLIALEHETIDSKVSMNKLKQQLRQELITNKTFYPDFFNGNIVNDFDQYAYRTVQIHRFVI